MTAVTDSRNIIQAEEVNFNASISEATLTRMAATSNFISNRQYDTLKFDLNGNYNKASGQTGLEGLYVLLFDIEIVGVSLGNAVPGSGGTTTFDIHLIDGGGTDQGSIFSTKPSITSVSSTNSYAAENYETATSQTSTGITLPVIPTKTYDQFDAFRIDIDSTMVDAENAFLAIHFRPR